MNRTQERVKEYSDALLRVIENSKNMSVSEWKEVDALLHNLENIRNENDVLGRAFRQVKGM